jgi:methyl-accepting chemotaxis protein
LRKNIFLFSGIAIFIFFSGFIPAMAEDDNLTGRDLIAKQAALSCRDEVIQEMEKLVESNVISFADLFDTFYIPIPDTDPPKYHTQYDRHTDKVLRIILDKYLGQQSWFLYVVAVDRNGYVPTHNSKYSKALTDDPDYNLKHNRTKRIANDRTGLAAARNTDPYLLQQYERDTGNTIADLSVPIYIRGKHWGAIRVGYGK